MADVNDIIHFIKTLKKGFDNDLFQSKIDDLAYAVDAHGLVYDDFHTLFQVWLNLSIPISKWVILGSCLVPPDIVKAGTVKYALRWLLANIYNQANHSRVAYLLDWLTAAMECESIDMVALDAGYEVFFTSLTFDGLTPHALKLIYTLTKPVDVTRRRVTELQAYTKIREGKKNMFRQLQVLLGLFKSYKPECVPEDVPAISIHAAFTKLNVPLLAKFKRNQEKRNRLSKKIQHILWGNTLNSDRSKNKKAIPLVPKLQHIDDKNATKLSKKFQDFSDPVSLVQYSRHHLIARPAQLRSLLCNETGLAMLAVMPYSTQAFMSHDVHHLLQNCFLEVSPYSYAEKQDFLRRLALLQRTALQGLPVLSRFLAQYLPLWNETEYVPEILDLVEYVSILYPEHIKCIVECLSRFYRRAQPMEQCAILRSLTAMYTNLVYAGTKTRYHFQDMAPSRSNYQQILPFIAARISDLCNTELQVNPDELRVIYTSLWSAERRALSELKYSAAIGAMPLPLTLALPLLNVSAGLIDTVAGLLILYGKIISSTKDVEEKHREKTCHLYLIDLINCLYTDRALSERTSGIVFERLHPQLVYKLSSIIPDVDSKLSLRNHVAYALYTRLITLDMQGADNMVCLRMVIDQEFPKLSQLMRTALSELR